MSTYWHKNYWHENYWHDNYWLETPAIVSPIFLSVKSDGRNPAEIRRAFAKINAWAKTVTDLATKNHSGLNELAYSVSGHTSFAGTSVTNTFTATQYLYPELADSTHTVVGVITKTTTGNPSQTIEPMICLNTFDNTISMYADGAWRTLASW